MSLENQKHWTPSEIVTSTDGSDPTKVKFNYPIYLAPGQEYAIVLLAPNSDQYEVWTAKMGERSVETQNLPNSEAVRYSRQFALGSLFKSQNGSTWTPAQKSDLKFKLWQLNLQQTLVLLILEILLLMKVMDMFQPFKKMQ